MPEPVHWDALPIALLDGQRVRGATRGAGEARVRIGMPISEARARCAALRIASWDDDTIAQEVTRATAAFVKASPQVTPATGAPGTWWIGATGFESLGGERTLGRRLLAIAREWHPAARIGIADSCVAARAATWANAAHAARQGNDGVIVVPHGGCAAYLSDVPVGLVSMDEELRETLQALGLRTAGAFARLDGQDVERRWGSEGLAAWRLARGDDPRRPVLARLDAARAVSADLSPSAPTTEPILFLVRAALDRLVGELVADARAAVILAITLTLDDARGAIPGHQPAHTITREVRLSRPLARVVPLFERCRALLDDWRLPAPICGVSVAITATAPLAGEQGELLDPSWRDPAAADAAFARLRAALGTSAIVRPVVRDTHRPEQAGGWERVDEPPQASPAGYDQSLAIDRPTEPPHGRDRAPTHALKREVSPLPAGEGAASGPLAPPAHTQAFGGAMLSPRRLTPEAPATPIVRVVATSPTLPALPFAPALRQLETPEAIEVRCTANAPSALRWGERHIPIARAVGPERLAGDWWAAPYARDYWRCEDTTGTSDLLIYRERALPSGEDRWFVHGWYD